MPRAPFSQNPRTHLLEPWGRGLGPVQGLPSVLGPALLPAWAAASEEERRLRASHPTQERNQTSAKPLHPGTRAPVGRAGAGNAHLSPGTAHASCRLLLWAAAGTRGYSAGSAGHLALAQAPVLAQALALALAAGCLGSEEEHWSGDAGFSRGRRRRKEFSSTPSPRQPATDILPTLDEAERDKPARSPGRRSS